MSQRRRFSPEYKQEAVQLVQQSDLPVAEIARNLGINENMLRPRDPGSHHGLVAKEK